MHVFREKMKRIQDSNRLDSILKQFENPAQSDLGKILLAVQQEFVSLDEHLIRRVAEYVGVSATEAYGYATFYSMYKLHTPGRIVLKVCNGTACHVKGAKRLVEDIENYLGIKTGETTADGLITFEISSCIGVCALAPVLVINGRTYTRVNFKIIQNLIDEIRREHPLEQ
jgi:NADH-quinone oxidoreductase subunit E